MVGGSETHCVCGDGVYVHSELLQASFVHFSKNLNTSSGRVLLGHSGILENMIYASSSKFCFE